MTSPLQQLQDQLLSLQAQSFQPIKPTNTSIPLDELKVLVKEIVQTEMVGVRDYLESLIAKEIEEKPVINTNVISSFSTALSKENLEWLPIDDRVDKIPSFISSEKGSSLLNAFIKEYRSYYESKV